MGTHSSKQKYVVLYGVQSGGKTLMQYYMQSTLKDIRDIDATEGYNYEEVTINNTNLGVFDVSGDPMQYEIVNIILKCVSVTGLIFMVPIDRMDELDKSKDLLKLFLSNNHLKEDISILIVYNFTSKIKDSLSWIDQKLLDSRMKLDKIKEQFKIQQLQSIIVDVNNLDKSNFKEILENFVQSLEKVN